MKRSTLMLIVLATLLLSVQVEASKSDDFGSIVKMIEQFYNVKHTGVPFVAKAGIKVFSTAARIKGGTAKQIAEAGSVKVAVFENQSFNTRSDFTRFRTMLNENLRDSWTPLVQTLSSTDRDQCYVFIREAGEKFNVVVITIESQDGTVVQVTVSPKNLLLLLKDPEGMGKSISDEATTTDQD